MSTAAVVNEEECAPETKKLKLDDSEQGSVTVTTESLEENGNGRDTVEDMFEVVDEEDGGEENGEEENGEGEEEGVEEAVTSGESKSERNTKIGIEDNDWFGEGKKGEVGGKRSIWESSDSKDDESLQIFQEPFRHGEIRDFVKNKEFLQEFVKLFDELQFQEKSSDLFQFRQSLDLNSIVDPHVYSISEYLSGKVLPFMKELTGLPLNQTIDLFLSAYTQTDFLLCHDDELDSRRIAFIWYLSEEWLEEYGGTLDLFSSTESLHPDKIVKKIVPEYNKFVFFEVGATSFHQVSEILEEGKNRFALSGWFYGEPLPRPKIEFPSYYDSSYNVLESYKDFKGLLEKLCHPQYLKQNTQTLLNQQLCDESQLLIHTFLQPDVYKTLCEKIVEADVSESDSSFFTRRGPVNLFNFEEAIPGPSGQEPPADTESSENSNIDVTIDALRNLFHSTEFLGFLEKITEFPFTSSSTNRVVSSLLKYSNGSYTLLRSDLKQQRQLSSANDDEDEEADEEPEPNFIDLMFYFAHKWEYEYGGDEVFCDTECDEPEQLQLMSIQPEGNALALAVRTNNVTSFTKYVNCLAKENVYFVYKMTFAFDGKFE